MPQTQKELFGAPQNPGVKMCTRCAKPCRVAAKVNPNADLFVKGTMETGKFCAECLVTDFLQNFEYGGQNAFNYQFVPAGRPCPRHYDGQDWETRKIFDPEGLRLPHMQEQFASIVITAQKQFGAELTPEEFDWDEVIANWHLPFPEKPTRGKRGKGRK